MEKSLSRTVQTSSREVTDNTGMEDTIRSSSDDNVIVVPLEALPGAEEAAAENADGQHAQPQQTQPHHQEQQQQQQQSNQFNQHSTCLTDAQCLHGGRCVQDVIPANTNVELPASNPTNNIPLQHCDCLEGYGGARCELHCPLDCQHGGVCHNIVTAFPQSANTNTNTNISTTLQPQSPFSQFSRGGDQHEHNYQCKCFGYYTGKLCDVPYENCSDGKQCYYGGKCRSNNNNNNNRRKLDNADSLITTGSTSSHCVCPTTYGGDSCEIPTALVDGLVTSSNSESSTMTTGVTTANIAAMVLLVVIIALSSVGLFLHRWRVNRPKTDRSRGNKGSNKTRKHTYELAPSCGSADNAATSPLYMEGDYSNSTRRRVCDDDAADWSIRPWSYPPSNSVTTTPTTTTHPFQSQPTNERQWRNVI